MDKMADKLFAIIMLFCSVMSVASECTASNKRGTTELNATYEFQNLYSPGWRVSYLPSMDCKWIIDSGDSDTKLIIDVTYVNIENSPGCAYDSLSIYDGPTTSGTRLERMCNVWNYGKMFTTSGQYALIQQRSDFSMQTLGFSLRYMAFKTTATTACSSTESLTSSVATTSYITSPNFPVLADVSQTCTWLITASNNVNFIVIEMLFMDIEGGEACFDDKLKIFDGTSNTATLLSEFCENRIVFPMKTSDAYTIVTTQSKAFIQLESVKTGTTRSGFILSYNETASGITPSPVPTITTPAVVSQCGGTFTATSSPLFISTPGYPETFYSNDLDCTWVISTSSGYQIALDVIDSFLELSDGCLNDRVSIFDGPTSSYPLLTRFCGENSLDVNSTGTSVLVSFHSDSSTTARGFKLSYQRIKHDVPDCTTGGNFTDLNATTTTQYFTSNNYPNNHDNDLVERWLIRNPTNEGVIKIKVVDSRVEASHGCVMDKVSVYKGPCTSYPLLGTFCGEETPTYYQDKGNYVLIIFTADERLNFKGFNISYSIVSSIPETGIPTVVIIGIIIGCTLAGIFLIILLLVIIKIILKQREKRKRKAVGKVATMGVGEERASIMDNDTEMEAGPSTKLEKIPDVHRVMKKRLPVLSLTFKPRLPKIKRRAEYKT